MDEHIADLAKIDKPSRGASSSSSDRLPSPQQAKKMLENGHQDHHLGNICLIGVLTLVLVVVAILLIRTDDSALFTDTGQAPEHPERVKQAAGDTKALDSSWHTPLRAAFLVAADLKPQLRSKIESILSQGPLPLVERDQLDVILREHDMANDGRLSAESAVRIGRLAGGHVGLSVEAFDDSCALRAYLIETGELVAVKTSSEDDLADNLVAVLQVCCERLDVQGTIRRDGSAGRHVVSIGAGHGLRPGDRLLVFDRPSAHQQHLLTEVGIRELKHDSAIVTNPGLTLPDRAYVVKKRSH